MLDEFRTAVARFLVRYLTRPSPLVIRAWLWLGAEADEVEDKRRCLNAVLQLDPENEPAS